MEDIKTTLSGQNSAFPEEMTEEEVARYCRVSKDTIARMRKSGTIPVTVYGIRNYRYRKSVIDEWKKSRTVEVKD